HPLCKACRTPLAVAIDGRGNAETRCPSCGDRATYSSPAGLPSIYPAVRAVLASEQRTDRPTVKIATAQAGVEAVLCPQCGAGLQLEAREMVTCQYCKTTARVPRRIVNRARGQDPPFESFWILIDGPSPKRLSLVHGGARSEEDGEANAAVASA